MNYGSYQPSILISLGDALIMHLAEMWLQLYQVYYIKCKLTMEKWGRPGNEATVKEAIELGWKDGPRAPGSTAGETAYLKLSLHKLQTNIFEGVIQR